jgi:hypothetical protein
MGPILIMLDKIPFAACVEKLDAIFAAGLEGLGSDALESQILIL